VSPEAAEELPHVADQEVGDFHSGEVPAPVELRPVLDLVVGVHHRPHERLGGEERPPLRCLAWRAPFRRVCSLVQEPGRRGSGTGVPVNRDVGKQLIEVDRVFGELGRLSGPLLEVLDDPGQLANRRVGEGVGDGLGTVRLELEVSRSLLTDRLSLLYGLPVGFRETGDRAAPSGR
jgi:hypothetical protein